MMEKKPTFLAIIPARCGSKGLPGKNTLPLAGKPLLAWSVEAALNSKYITETIVSSDCKEILDVAQNYGAFPLQRPKELALDLSPSEPLIHHAIEHFRKEGKEFDYTILLQPTSPLRDSADIDNAIEYLLKKRANALISVYEPEHSPFKSFKVNKNGYLRGLIDDESPFMRRQDLPRTYMPNGAIYIIKTNVFTQCDKLFTKDTLPFIMSREKSIDIDGLDDFKKIENLLNKLK